MPDLRPVLIYKELAFKAGLKTPFEQEYMPQILSQLFVRTMVYWI